MLFFINFKIQYSSAPAFEANILPCLFEVIFTHVFASSLLEKDYLSAAIVGAHRHLSCTAQIGLYFETKYLKMSTNSCLRWQQCSQPY